MHLAVCDLNQHRLIILCRMVGEGSRGRKRRLPGTIEPCKERRHCGADRCNEQLVGTSISQHYKSKTDFGKLKELRSLPRQLAEEKLKTLDPHLAYMFRHNHSATNLPHWKTHKPVAKPIPKAFQRRSVDQNDNEEEKEEEEEESEHDEAGSAGDHEEGGLVEPGPGARHNLQHRTRYRHELCSYNSKAISREL